MRNSSFKNRISLTRVCWQISTPDFIAILDKAKSSLKRLMPKPPRGRSVSNDFPFVSDTQSLLMRAMFNFSRFTPRLCKKSQDSRLMYSPQTRWNGYVSYSNKMTRYPCRAIWIDNASPANPPPTIARSYFVLSFTGEGFLMNYQPSKCPFPMDAIHG